MLGPAVVPPTITLDPQTGSAALAGESSSSPRKTQSLSKLKSHPVTSEVSGLLQLWALLGLAGKGNSKSVISDLVTVTINVAEFKKSERSMGKQEDFISCIPHPLGTSV